MNTYQYKVGLTWETGRKGMLSSPDVNASSFDGGFIEVATPPQFPKGVPGVWSPEHLLVAAVSSCFMTTFLAISEKARLNFADFSCNAEGTLEEVDGSLVMSEITLRPKVVMTDESPEMWQRADLVLLQAERACIITRSIKTTVKSEPQVVFAERVPVSAIK